MGYVARAVSSRAWGRKKTMRARGDARRRTDDGAVGRTNSLIRFLTMISTRTTLGSVPRGVRGDELERARGSDADERAGVDERVRWFGVGERAGKG